MKTSSASPTASRTPFGKFLIRVAVMTGHRINAFEASIRNARFLSAVPPQYRRVVSRMLKLILLLAVVSVAFLAAFGIAALWTFVALSRVASHAEEPGVHEVSHPQHQYKYPELYDEHGSVR
ncbi:MULTISPECIES: hypothetical protein [unclassified Pseudomonas]|uniref:hypothetical protein n=1 Tax=unclassified Pseudomonas TaxID=196821 RepID=UPI0025CF4EF1|nr:MULTISPECIES: hypothetical protein [unclassified Pseudomonas]